MKKGGLEQEAGREAEGCGSDEAGDEGGGRIWCYTKLNNTVVSLSQGCSGLSAQEH